MPILQLGGFWNYRYPRPLFASGNFHPLLSQHGGRSHWF
jgi:hypothetical protein